MNYLDLIPPELVVEILLYLNIDDIQNLMILYRNVRNVINTKLFWIKKLQLEKMREYIPFLGGNRTYIEDYKEFMEIEEEVYNILTILRTFNGAIDLRFEKDVDIKDLVHKYTPREIAKLITFRSDIVHDIYIEYKGRFKGKYKYQYGANFIDENILNVTAGLNEEEVKILLIKLRLGGISLNSVYR